MKDLPLPYLFHKHASFFMFPKDKAPIEGCERQQRSRDRGRMIREEGCLASHSCGCERSGASTCAQPRTFQDGHLCQWPRSPWGRASAGPLTPRAPCPSVRAPSDVQALLRGLCRSPGSIPLPSGSPLSKPSGCLLPLIWPRLLLRWQAGETLRPAHLDRSQCLGMQRQPDSRSASFSQEEESLFYSSPAASVNTGSGHRHAASVLGLLLGWVHLWPASDVLGACQLHYARLGTVQPRRLRCQLHCALQHVMHLRDS